MTQDTEQAPAAAFATQVTAPAAAGHDLHGLAVRRRSLQGKP